MIKKILVLLCLLNIVACAKQEVPMSNGEWLNIFIDEAGFETYESLDAWEIEINDEVLKEAINKSFIQDVVNDLKIQTINLDTLDEHPKNKEVMEILDLIVDALNDPVIKDEANIEYQESVLYIDDYRWIEDQLWVKINLHINQYFYLGNNQSTIYQVNDIVPYEDGYMVDFQEVNYEDAIESMKLSGSLAIDLDQSTIEYNEAILQTPSPYQNIIDFDYHFNYEGYEISLSSTSNSISAYISRNIDGVNYFTDVDLSNFSFNYLWDYQDKQVQEAFFKFGYESNLRVGVSRSKFVDKNLTLNVVDTQLSDVIADNFKKMDILDQIIPLAKLSIPIPQTPSLTLNVILNLHIYANGSVELRIDNQNEIGFEIKNNCLRKIQESDHDIDFSLKASANATVGVEAALSLFNYKLMNAGSELGVASYVKPVIHLYDDKQMYQETDELDAEALSEINDPRIAVCADLSLNWIGKCFINGPGSIAGKLGLNYEYEFLGEDDQILSNGSTHMENWQFVDHCTKDRDSFSRVDLPNNQIGISLESYQMILNKDEVQKIEVLSFPSNLAAEDFTMKCKNSQICEVSNWQVKAKEKGTTIIMIESKDERYYAQVHLIVAK